MASARTVTISATYTGAGIVQKATLTVRPPGAATLADFALNPQTIIAGDSATGTPDRNDCDAHVVPAGATTVAFRISTTQFTPKGRISVTATAGGVSKTVMLTVQ